MNRLSDLEGSLRKILKEQLRELVKRCAPLAEKADQGQLTQMIEEMISAWIEADPRSRKAVLGVSIKKISEEMAQIKAVRAAKQGLAFVASSSSPHFLPGKAYIKVGGKLQNVDNPGFTVLDAKSIKKARLVVDGRILLDRAASGEVAKRLKLNSTYLEGMRQKLRSSGLDIAFVAAGSFKNSRKAPDRVPISKRYD